MRLPILSAALCGLAFIPRVVSQSAGSGSEATQKFLVQQIPGNKYDCVPSADQEPCRAICINKDGDFVHDSRCALVDSTSSITSATSTTTAVASNGQVAVNLGTTQAAQPTNGIDPAQQTNNSSDKGKTSVGAIAGGVVGGIIVLALIGALAFFLVRRRRRARSSDTQGESVAVFDKSRASSPTSHAAISPIYSAGAPAVPSQPQLQTQPQPQAAAPPPPPPPPAPEQPVAEPVELQSREVDDDGVSVNSFDMARPAEDRVVPRLPVYHRGTPPGGSAAAS
ncbi:hypothetical protein FN846DRAFT_954630 [Sphaerosporella brunnea]|uniref:Extracellular membrane protein CFEM domain-containing protein n=1 Tax=Sphaerosporella brunnea TaxID=1250544 RepID=A0A5J5ETX1_9PEZI|nr:hypothetical protein FN846DRAFT_954630 [Sphaerosporella brunnea]